MTARALRTEAEPVSFPPPRRLPQGQPPFAGGALGIVSRKAAGEMLFLEGDPADHVYQVTSGLVSLYKFLPDGRRQIVDFPSRGRHLGFVAGDVYTCSAEAITSVKVTITSRREFERMVGRQPELARKLLAANLEEMQSAHDQLLLLGRKNAMEKVASFLITLADRQKRGSGPIEVPMPRVDIADYLGLTIETVSRTLSRLKSDGVIAFPHATAVEIVGRDHLEE